MAKEEISLKDFILRILSIIKILKRNAGILVLIIILIAPLGYFFPKKPSYTAKTTLLLNTSGGKRGFMSIASSLGLGESAEIISFEKFEMIATSNKLLNQIIEDSVTIDGKKDLLGHHLIDKSNLKEKWQKSHPTLLKAKLNENGPTKDTVLSYLQYKLIKLFDISEGKGELVEITAKHLNEDLAQQVSIKVAEKGIKFFLDRSVSKDIKTKNVLNQRIDSVKVAISMAEIAYSNIKDKSHRSVKTQIQINLITAQRQLTMLNELYLQLVKQLEMIEFKINNANSGLEIIDAPTKPLIYTSKSLLKRLLMSCFLSVIISISLILGVFYLKKGLKLLKELN